MSRRRHYVPEEIPMEESTAQRTTLPIEVAPVAVQECVDTRLDADGTRDQWSPAKQSPIDVKRHLEDLASDWDVVNPNSYTKSVEAYGVLLLIARRMSPTGWQLFVTVNQNHYLKLAKS